MLVHVKTPHTEIEIKGEISKKVLEVLKFEYGENLIFEKETYIDPFTSDWFMEVKESLVPADYLKTDRENMGLTQKELGLKIGNFSRQYISDLENGRKNISLTSARKLSDLFNRPVNRYI